MTVDDLSLEEAMQLYESMPPLLEGVLKQLLEHTTRLKVLRLVARLAEVAEYPWMAFARYRV